MVGDIFFEEERERGQQERAILSKTQWSDKYGGNESNHGNESLCAKRCIQVSEQKRSGGIKAETFRRHYTKKAICCLCSE